MHFLILGAGVAIGLYALYRFFLQARPYEIKIFFLASITLVLLLALFFMAVTGRLPAAIGLFIALLPFLREYLAVRKKSRDGEEEKAQDGQEEQGRDRGDIASGRAGMDRSEALDILGLEQGATLDEINLAYKELMKKMHPDTKGSQGLARKLNEARQVLLKNRGSSDSKS